MERKVPIGRKERGGRTAEINRFRILDFAIGYLAMAIELANVSRRKMSKAGRKMSPMADAILLISRNFMFKFRIRNR